MIKWLFIVLLIFAVADFLGVKTKSLLSGPFVTLIAFLAFFALGILPTDIIDQAGMTKLASMSIYLLMVDMGTMIDLREMKREWRTVLLAALSVVFACVGILCLIPVIGKAEALTAMPIVNGALQASIIMLNASSEKGLIMAYTLGAMCYAMQKFVGTVPASYCGRKLAQQLIVEYRENKAKGVDLLAEGSAAAERKPTFYEKYKKFYTNPTILAAIALTAYIASLCQEFTGINYTIYCLLFGCIIRNVGLLPEKPLTTAKTAGIMNVACFANLIPALANINVSDLASLSGSLVLVFGAALASIFLFVRILPGWKIVGSKDLAYGICMGQLLGFPATMLVSNEIVVAFSDTPDEAKYIERKITVPYVLSGLVSATVLSVVVASICAQLL